ncbi:MAG: hypothetical protein ABIG89_03485 [Candidatus Woesearchaeota archaeon]
MDKKLVLSVVLLVIVVLSASFAFSANIYSRMGSTPTSTLNLTNNTGDLFIMGFRVWADMNDNISSLVFNLTNEGGSFNPSTDLASLGNPLTSSSGIQLYGDNNYDGVYSAGDLMVPSCGFGSWSPSGSGYQATLGSCIAQTNTNNISSEPSQDNFFVIIKTATGPTDGAKFNVTISQIKTNSNSTGITPTSYTNVTSQTLIIDGTNPTESSTSTRDNNSNGYIEGFTVVFDEAIDDNTFNSTMVGPCFQISQDSTGGVPITIATAISTGETANDTTILINFTQLQWTNTTPMVNYTNNATCGITDIAGNALQSGIFAYSADDTAPPVFFGCNAYDNNADGSLDNINCSMSENVSESADGFDTSFFTAYVNYGGAAENNQLTINGVNFSSSGSDQNNISINLSGNVIGTGNVSLSYSPSGSKLLIADTVSPIKNTQALANTSVTVTDSAGPSMLTAITIDTNSNGYIDAMNVTFSENITASAINFNHLVSTCFRVSGSDDGAVTNTTGTEGDQYVFFNFTQQQWTNITPTINYTYNETCGFRDASSNPMANIVDDQSVITITSVDGAPPAFLGCNAYDKDGEGKLDAINCSLSEALSEGPIKNSLFSTYVNYGSTTENRQLTISSVNTTGGLTGDNNRNITIILDDAVYGTGNVSLTYTTAADGINDTKNNATLSNSTIVVTDSAAPFVIAKFTIDKDSNGYLDAFAVNFSEGISNNTYGANAFAFNASNNITIGLLGSNITNGALGHLCAGPVEGLCLDTTNLTYDPAGDYFGNGGVNDSVLFLNFTSTAKYNFTTGQWANVSIDINGTTLIEDLVGNDLANNKTGENATDKAAPVFWAQGYSQDIDNNGALDHINLSLSEVLSANLPTAAGFTALVTYDKDSNGFVQRTLSVSSATAIAAGNVTLALSDAVFGTGNVSLSYTSGQATQIQDAAGNVVATNASIDIVDNASAIMFSKQTLDNNHNGYLDAIQLNFSEPILNSSVNSSANFTIGCQGSKTERDCVNTSAITVDSDNGFGGANDSVLYLNITTADGLKNFTTGDVMNVTYTQSSNDTISNLTGIKSSELVANNQSSVNATDTAGPVLWYASSYDLDGNGAVDSINFTASEALTAGTVSKGTFVATVNYGPGNRTLTNSDINATGTLLNLKLSNAVYGTGALNASFTQATGSVNDSAGNLLITNTTITVSDNVSAIFLSALTLDTNTNGYLDAVQINFSEGIGNLTFGTSGSTAFNLTNNITLYTSTATLLASDLSAIDTVNGFEGVNDSVIYLNFTGTTFNTGDTPVLNMSFNGTSYIQDLAGNNITYSAKTEDNTTTDLAGPVIWKKETLDFNRTGYLDTINITFSESIDESTCDGGNFSFETVTATMDTAFPGDSTDDTYLYWGFSGTDFFTNGTPSVNYTQDTANSATENCTDIAGNLLVNNNTALGHQATDTAPPVILTAVASDATTSANGPDSDDYILFTFSEAVNWGLSQATLGSTSVFNDTVHSGLSPGTTSLGLFYLNNSAILWDIGVGNFNNSQNLTMNMTFNSSLSDITAPNTMLIFMNASWRDTAGNTISNDNKTNVSLTGSFQDVSAPTVSTWWTNDSDADGYIDSIVVTMSENVNNDTCQCGVGWNVTGYSVVTGLSTCDNNTLVNLTITELSVFDTNATPVVYYNSSIGCVRDVNNNNALADTNSTATDKALPVLLNATTYDNDGDGYIDAYNLTFSENVTDDTFNRTGEATKLTLGNDVNVTNNLTGTFKNDQYVNLIFPDNKNGSNMTPDITGSFFNDTAGNAMAILATAGLSEYDNVAPQFWVYSEFGGNFTNRTGTDGYVLDTKFRNGQNISIKLNVSENVTQPAITIDDRAATLVGTTNTTEGVMFEYYFVVTSATDTEGTVVMSISATELTGNVGIAQSTTNTSQNLSLDYTATAVTGLSLVDNPQDNGTFLKFSWTANTEDDFSSYTTHCSVANTSNLSSLTAVNTSTTQADTSAVFNTYNTGTAGNMKNGETYYCVVNVTDSLGNSVASMNYSGTPYVNGNVSLTQNAWNLVGTPHSINGSETFNTFGRTGFSSADTIYYYNASDSTWYTMGTNDKFEQLKGYWMYNYDGNQVNYTYRADSGQITSKEISLSAGWNLIGSPTANENLNVTTALGSLGTNWFAVYMYTQSDGWKVNYRADSASSSFQTFNASNGYWVYMNAADNYAGEVW